MSAIITHRFRKNNVQNIFDEMVSPKVMISSCSSSGTTVTPTTGIIPANLQTGMAVTLTSGTGALTTSVATIVTSVGTNSFTVYPQPVTTLSSALLSFYSQYYVGIGKSDPYSGIGLDGTESKPGAPVAAPRTSTEVLNNLIALQRVSVAPNSGNSASQSAIYGNAGYVLPRYVWSAGSYYKAWDSSDPSCLFPSTVTINGTDYTAYPCFVTHVSGTNNRLYVCVQSGLDRSDVKVTAQPPSQNATIVSQVGSASTDTYRWVYVSDLGLDTASTITAQGLSSALGNAPGTLDSNQFFKVYRRATTTGSSSTITTAYSSSAGAIYSIRLVTGGSGYTVNTPFVVDGDGTSTASGYVTSVAANGAIQAVTVTVSGAGYNSGVVRFTSGAGSGAVLYPRISPRNGFGYDVTDDLPCWYAGFYSIFSYDTVYPGSADVPSTDQIRQVSLVRNPVVFTSSTGSSITYRCLKYLTVNTGSTGITAGDVLQISSGSSSGSRAYVDFVTVTGSSTIIYYHQNQSSFAADKSITPIPIVSGSGYSYWKKPNYTTQVSSGTYIVTATSSAEEYTAGTGEVIYVQNRVPITQAPGQSEPISIITQF